MDRTLLTPDERTRLADEHPDWDIGETSMNRVFAFGDFSESMGFVTRVAIAAEQADHHPDIDIRWNRVTLTLSTHSEGGLTGLDQHLAEAFDGFV